MKWFDESVSVTTLDNGVTVVNDYVPAALAGAADITVSTGSHLDSDDKLGLAHFSEHLLMHGTPGMTADEIDALMASYGMFAKYGHYNLSTGADHTWYWANGIPEGVDHYMTAIATAINVRAYTPAHLELERGRIIQEMENAVTEEDRLSSHARNLMLYSGGRLSRWLGGYPEFFPRLTMDDVRDYHERTHFGGNTVIFRSGPWSHDQAIDWAQDNLGNLGRGENLGRITSPYNPDDVRKPTPLLGERTRVHLGADLGADTPENASVRNIASALLSERFSQLAKALRLYSLSSTFSGANPKETQAIASFKVAPERVREVAEACAKVWKDTLDTATPEEFTRHQANFLATVKLDCAFENANVRRRISMVKEGYFNQGNPLAYSDTEQRIRGTTFEQVRGIFEQICTSKIGTAALGQIRDDFPTGAEIETMLGQSGVRADKFRL